MLSPVPAVELFERNCANFCGIANGKRSVPSVQRFERLRRVSNASDDMRRVVGLMEEALKTVGRRSRLNALRLKKYGVAIDG